MCDSDSAEPHSNVSDCSFVILGDGSLLDQRNDEYLEGDPNSDLTVISECTDTYSDHAKSNTDKSKFSISEDSIQDKFELMKENFLLKETLRQNNLAIKSQLDTFFMWQQEVLKIHKAHKQKFLETKNLILKLRSENLSLKNQLENYLNHDCNDKTVNYSSEIITKSEDVVDESMKQITNSTSELLNGDENLTYNNHELIEKLENAKKEILELKKNLKEIAAENLLLKLEVENFKKNSTECNSYKSSSNAEGDTQISNLLKHIEEEEGKLLKLKEALTQTHLNDKKGSDLNISTTDTFSHCLEKLNNINLSLDQQNERFNGFYSWVFLAEEKLKKDFPNDEQAKSNLMSDLKDFKNHLNLEENIFKEKQVALQELKNQYIELLNDYKSVQQQLNLLSQKSQNIEENEKKIIHLSEELEMRDKDLIEKNQDCNSLKEEIQKLNSDWNEKVRILEIQIELYKADFNCERQEREKIAGEKEQMAEQIRLLQSQLSKFDKDYSGGNDHQRSSPLESTGKRSTYMCPKCMFSFHSLERCEEHIEDCLNIHMYP